MALDLLFGRTQRNWSRFLSPSGGAVRARSFQVDSYSPVARELRSLSAANPGLSFKQRGKGGVLVKTWKF